MNTFLHHALLELLIYAVSISAAAPDARALASRSFVSGPWALAQHGFVTTLSLAALIKLN
jgi:hypothetical protein